MLELDHSGRKGGRQGERKQGREGPSSPPQGNATILSHMPFPLVNHLDQVCHFKR